MSQRTVSVCCNYSTLYSTHQWLEEMDQQCCFEISFDLGPPTPAKKPGRRVAQQVHIILYVPILQLGLETL
jgi:hypothetical protein